MAKPSYKFDSAHKNYIRERWVAYIKEALTDEEAGATIITFPSNEIQELILYESKGLIKWEETETKELRIVKGNVICFEKDNTKWMELKAKLPFATVEREFGGFLTSNAKAIAMEKIKVFPVDAINLDYEKNISKNEIPLDVIFELVFQFQSKYKKSFSFFLTWPFPRASTDDDPAFIDSLKRLIADNLEDRNAVAFKNIFEANNLNVENLPYEKLSITGLTKKLLKKATQSGYQLSNKEFYTYGEPSRHSMMSVLFKFDYVGHAKSSTKIYSEDVAKALDDITDLRDVQN
jgi:hypothetical protein